VTPPPTAAGPGWTVVLPLKGGSGAKSRLGASPALAAAIALDCLDAVLGCPETARVVVVTPDAATAAAAREAGADVVPESRPGTGLLAAVADGLAAARGPVAVLLGDLPALRPRDLATALRAAAEALHGAPAAGGGAAVFVPDAEGTGTVLLAGTDAAAVRPSFGPASAAEHARSGARRLDLRLPRLRRDVDTRGDLATALALGVGPRTAAVLRAEHGDAAALP
jgi:2-phospho-L-lactate guanylyltransferase